jgi:hypothetical protein
LRLRAPDRVRRTSGCRKRFAPFHRDNALGPHNARTGGFIYLRDRNVWLWFWERKVIKAGSFGLGGILLGTASWLLDRGLNTNTKLDLLAVEGEYYPSKYANSQEYMWEDRSPMPYTGPTGLSYSRWNDSLAKTDDDWKWSV